MTHSHTSLNQPGHLDQATARAALPLWRRAIVVLAVTAMNLQAVPLARAQVTPPAPPDGAMDVSPFPFTKDSANAVRANLMFIMDDSGSMGWTHLPDDDVTRHGYCYGFKDINRIAYDPALNYQTPVSADGTPMPTANFFAALANGYSAFSFTVDLSNNLNLYNDIATRDSNGIDGQWGRVQNNGLMSGFDQNGAVATNVRYYYTMRAPAATGTASTQCETGGSRAANWRMVTTLPVAQQQNYATWYSYYRTRLNIMKSSVGLAMQAVDRTRFRIGFSRINSPLLTSANFMPVADMNATSMATFYANLYGTNASGSTPLRPALEKIGKYYANKTINNGSTGIADPVQYSCQRNYALLTTDGYYNRGNEDTYRGGSTYIPRDLSGNPIGNVDTGTAVPRPLRDEGVRNAGNAWVVSASGTGGVGDTLSDIAAYFYKTDLRQSALGNCTGASGIDVCDNNLKETGTNKAKYQHMTTFSLGLGLAGNLTYQANYETAKSGSFFDIANGALAWPNPNPSSSNPSATEERARADDLWHAAVNSYGKFYSAGSPSQLANGLTEALNSISAVAGVAAAAATSSLQPVAGDNYMFIGEYTTVEWGGNLRAHLVDPDTGAVSDTPLWNADKQLADQVATGTTSRNIFFRNPTTGQLTAFTSTGLTAAGMDVHFNNWCSTSKPGRLSQCGTFDATQEAYANSLENMVQYVRGSKANESRAETLPAMAVFRARPKTPLGDVVNSSPMYVKKPPFKYTENGYTAFKEANKNRQGVVYLASNDGMLHAINAETGDELWAYVPTEVMPRMHRRADFNYATTHEYMVDGSPVVGDAWDPATSSWRTILVGGLGGGGRGYYALDVTDPTPANVKVLWEINDSTQPLLGLSYGNPVIAKDKTGRWVVAFTSGYTAESKPGVTGSIGGADGNGHVFIYNLFTANAPGGLIRTISTYLTGTTPAGTLAQPSNLGRLQAWVQTETDNTALRMYSGDMRGNVWRIDFDNNLGFGNVATRIAELKGPTGATQPISASVNLSSFGTSDVPVVTVATGRYLGLKDVTDQRVQSLYAIKDDITSTTNLGSPRASTAVVRKTWAQDGSNANVRRLSNETMDWATKRGWYADFNLSAGERVNVDMAQASGFLGVASNIPTFTTACEPGGSSWLYIIGIKDAKALDSQAIDALAAGVNMVSLPSGVKFMEIDVNGKVHLTSSLQPNASARKTKRNSWREVIIGR
jgi:type IV pilus assembly protein PilY1